MGGAKHRAAREWLRRTVLQREQYRCFWCGERLHWYSLTLDHIVPRSHGGPRVYENIVAACSPCNNSRGDQLAEVWAEAKLGFVPPSKRAFIAQAVRAVYGITLEDTDALALPSAGAPGFTCTELDPTQAQE